MKKLMLGLLAATFLACGEGEPPVRITEDPPAQVEDAGCTTTDPSDEEDADDAGAPTVEVDAGTQTPDAGTCLCPKKNGKCKKHCKGK